MVSPSALSRQFKKRMGLTWREYQSATKIQDSIPILLDDGSVIDAQLGAGHESSGSFSHLFRLHTGISPRQYKQSIKQLTELLKKELSNHTSRQLDYYGFDNTAQTAQHKLYVDITGRSRHSVVFIGLYPKPLPKGVPIRGVALFHQDRFVVACMPAGKYHVMACELTMSSPRTFFDVRTCLRGKLDDPIAFPLTADRYERLSLRPLQPDDPPITTNLPQMLAWGLRQLSGS